MSPGSQAQLDYASGASAVTFDTWFKPAAKIRLLRVQQQ